MNTSDILTHLAGVIESRRNNAQAEQHSSYVAQLFQKGPDAFLKKIAEESAEVIMAAKDCQLQKENQQHLIKEVADLWFHSLILLAYYEAGPQDVLNELSRREGLSGLVEKASRSS